MSLLSPLKRPTFRLLWIGMSLSYAGDRLQELAQGWLVATLTNSALAVGGIGVLSSVGMLLMPLGGVIADQVDRRRILIVGQWAGALLTGVMALLAFTGRLAVWQIYLWALITGLVWMIVRPAYKVIITQAVPQEEVRPAVSLNSITETSAIVASNVGGSALLGWLGLPLAFLLNSFSYLIAVFCLGRVRLAPVAAGAGQGLGFQRVWQDLRAGMVYLAQHKALLYPLLLTFSGIVLAGPVSSVLPAIVNSQGGSLLQLGLLGGCASLGALAGAIYAGTRAEGDPLRTYPIWGILSALGVGLFIARPLSLAGGIGLASLGFLAFSQVVWNTSRVSALAEPAYQARLQSVTSMAFTLGTPLAAIWGGAAVDRFGLPALLAGAGVLVLLSLIVLLGRIRR
ncbi:MAG TPA: MFS transporter [Anaerolineales bacterium]|nr:MFS transporter [Anaerolineales bacterium]